MTEIPQAAINAARDALLGQTFGAEKPPLVVALEAAAPHLAAAERAREAQLDHCPVCVHRYGTGCGCECCAHVHRAVAAERERAEHWRSRWEHAREQLDHEGAERIAGWPKSMARAVAAERERIAELASQQAAERRAAGSRIAADALTRLAVLLRGDGA